ncbi:MULTISPECIES: SMP-30/gluconolactonase/LRE family protein [unclassified Ruegeria]|uniref:SMP-30/gluconolactonase/LRE family protein n=1 Tax=unclassified Ruegeria TaxID=2625375 RepID=UPI0014882B84|nr:MULTISPECIES: SMP-30/gluconolactonase/LRE family protein [unclassified Ruegeria]NOD46887.1 SMP-30/gluconolactonase/LRE family protein [Ruegeria sp. HKCCD5849]NOD51210.1 SMP-30/gluconolactonase/LRE family protein [Ruegeria sp. HKCCD5851]NOD68029.1 SMP-30/gluconolactonase/LRE family protein [Ruegeria sp. HKCCD7303]NOE33547.1 SMP-30/gluconolactonase/LRE family protein [Ruegeria sp. HKCCD7318]
MRILIAVILLGLAYLLFWPVPVTPVAVEMPEDAGFTGDFAENAALDSAQLVRLPRDEVGPEDIAVMPDGSVYTTSRAGTLYRIEEEEPVEVDRLGGRPLGLKAGPDGALYVADSFRGVMRWTGPGTLETVVGDINGAPVIYANQLDVAQDGTIYFSNSSDRFDPETMGGTKPTSVLTIWEQSETGYVARRTPDGTTQKIAEGFVYTNGVALSPEEDFLLIAETGRARVHKLWLTGPKAGKQNVLMDNLPGYPDNIEAQGDGTYWMAFASPRVPSEALMPYPFLRKIIWRLGPAVRPAPIHRGMMVQFDGEGRILLTLQDPQGRLGITTGGKIVADQFYVMTLDSPWFARMPVSDLP